MTNIDVASIVLSAVLGLDAFVAFRCGLAIVGLTVTFWRVMPLFIEHRIKGQSKRMRDLHDRRTIGRQ